MDIRVGKWQASESVNWRKKFFFADVFTLACVAAELNPGILRPFSSRVAGPRALEPSKLVSGCNVFTDYVIHEKL